MLNGLSKLNDTFPKLLDDDVDINVPNPVEAVLQNPLDEVVDRNLLLARVVRSIL